MAHERMRNEDARGGDVIVQDSVASGKLQLPIEKDPTGRDTTVAVTSEEPGEQAEDSGGSEGS